MKLVILDTPALYYRAYYALPKTLTAPDGAPINAAHGLIDLLTGVVSTAASTRLVATWDESWRPAFRTRILPEYKAARVRTDVPGETETPDALAGQLPIIRESLGALGIPVIGAEGYEADDVIATLVASAEEPDGVLVVTGDRDLFQLLAPGVDVLFPGKTMAQATVVTQQDLPGRYGVADGRQYLEMAAMRGDSSDGLTGVPGIGEKTAAALLAGYGSIDGILEAARAGSKDHGLSPRRSALLLEHEDLLRKTVEVMTVVRDLPVELPAPLPVPRASQAEIERIGAERRLAGPMGRFLAACGAVAGEGA